MAIIHQQVMPEGTPIEMLDEVTEEIGADENPPAGLLLHTHYEHAGRVHIMDVWESVEAHEKFGQERLGPAFQKVAAAHGLDPSQGGQPEESNIAIHRLVRGSL
jgi:hypothetical protein